MRSKKTKVPNDRDPDDMGLPAGKTCKDCSNFSFCVGLFGCKPTYTKCDWSPSRFTAPHNVTADEAIDMYFSGTKAARKK